MINKDVYDAIDKIMPFETALSFDNVGLLVGNMENEVEGIMICLDITEEVIEEAKKMNCNLLVSHHPVIFSGLKSISSNTAVYKLISYNMSAICCHTNFDLCEKIGVNRAFADVLGFEKIEKVNDYFQTQIAETSVQNLAKQIKEKFPNTVLQYSNMERKIKNVALCSGSGSGTLPELLSDVDAFVTGELKHDIWLLAKEKNIAVFALGHFETEHICVPYMKKYLEKNLRDINININISQNELNPVRYL